MLRFPALFKLQDVPLAKFGVVKTWLEHEVVAGLQRRARMSAVLGIAGSRHPPVWLFYACSRKQAVYVARISLSNPDIALSGIVCIYGKPCNRPRARADVVLLGRVIVTLRRTSWRHQTTLASYSNPP
jgi:hypothetical protein